MDELQRQDPTELALRTAAAPLVQLPRLDVAGIQQRVADIEQLIDSVMVEGVHYGPPFPGSDKKSLLQAGGELVFMAFQLVADPEAREEKLDGGHLRVICEGTVRTPDGGVVGRMTAECSTMEPKYRYRKQGRICPSCSQDGIMKSKYPDRKTGVTGGWYCNRKTGGCGESFGPDEESIVGQKPGRIEHPDPQELWHTIRMMSQKRWAVALARRTFALSARFVDEEAAQSAPFDMSKAGPILRAIPGDRQEKWNRCIGYCLTSFGKGPKDLNQLEGAVFMRWLGEQVTEASEFKLEDFGNSPEANGDVAGRAVQAIVPEPATTPVTAPDPGPLTVAIDGGEPFEVPREEVEDDGHVVPLGQDAGSDWESDQNELAAGKALDAAQAEASPPPGWERAKARGAEPWETLYKRAKELGIVDQLATTYGTPPTWAGEHCAAIKRKLDVARLKAKT